eukprot:1606552-Amphidinium_carterae.1
MGGGTLLVRICCGEGKVQIAFGEFSLVRAGHPLGAGLPPPLSTPPGGLSHVHTCLDVQSQHK